MRFSLYFWVFWGFSGYFYYYSFFFSSSSSSSRQIIAFSRSIACKVSVIFVTSCRKSGEFMTFSRNSSLFFKYSSRTYSEHAMQLKKQAKSQYFTRFYRTFQRLCHTVSSSRNPINSHEYAVAELPNTCCSCRIIRRKTRPRATKGDAIEK